MAEDEPCSVCYILEHDARHEKEIWMEMLPLVWKSLFNLSYFGEENDS
jgi:hypothetical protein